MLITESINILLAGALLPHIEPNQRNFAQTQELATGQGETLQAYQTGLLVNTQLQVENQKKLYASRDGARVLEQASVMALRSWSEIMGGEGGGLEAARRDSLLSMGGGVQDEEIELAVAILVSLSIKMQNRANDAAAPDEYAELAFSRARRSVPRTIEASLI
jgi:hypothetical protein